jgi:hypothetical protein
VVQNVDFPLWGVGRACARGGGAGLSGGRLREFVMGLVVWGVCVKKGGGRFGYDLLDRPLVGRGSFECDVSTFV